MLVSVNFSDKYLGGFSERGNLRRGGKRPRNKGCDWVLDVFDPKGRLVSDRVLTLGARSVEVYPIGDDNVVDYETLLLATQDGTVTTITPEVEALK